MLRRNYKAYILLCVFLILSLVLLTACGGGQPQKQEQKPAGLQPLKVTFAGSSPGGVWYMVMNGISECITRSYPGSAITVIPGEGVSNVNRVNGKEAQLGLSHSAIAASAVAGNEPFKEKLNNVSAIASLYPSVLQVVVTKKLGVTSFDEIMQRKIKVRLSVDSPGSTGELAFKRLITEYGVTYEDMKKWGAEIVFKGMGDSSDMLADGRIDGFSTMTLAPASPVAEAAVNKELVILDMNPDIIKKVSEKYGYGTDKVPAGTYKFQTNDLVTVSSYTVIIVPKDGSDEVAYSTAKALKENLDYLKSVHVALKELTVEKMIRNVGAPLHKGAEKYYKEIGVIK